MRGIAQATIAAVCLASLSGCAAPIIGGMTLGTLSMIADAVSTAITGKSLEEHGLSLITGKNCNFTESLFRKARKLCEENGSVEADKDFQGFFVAYGGPKTDPLERYAMARQREIAEEQEQDRLARIPEGMPKRYDRPHLIRVGHDVIFAMAPIYEPRDIVPLLVPVARVDPRQPQPEQVSSR
jgi:hypothetical protein